MKKRYLIASIIFAALAVLFVVLMIPKSSSKITAAPPQQTQSGPITSAAPSYESPIDFKALHKTNEDICGWLKIPGTNISYPVLQSPTDDKYYLRRDETGKKNINGSLFTEHVYNKNDFSDTATVIYGHHMTDGKMFADLQQYYTDDFEKYSDIVVYTPAEEIHYKAFAAVSFTNRHILYYYDCFNDWSMMQEFLDDLNGVRAIGSYVDKDVVISESDQLLILSTCLQGDRTCRFLVVGKRVN